MVGIERIKHFLAGNNKEMVKIKKKKKQLAFVQSFNYTKKCYQKCLMQLVIDGAVFVDNNTIPR